jgi:hypothetical protein
LMPWPARSFYYHNTPPTPRRAAAIAGGGTPGTRTRTTYASASQATVAVRVRPLTEHCGTSRRGRAAGHDPDYCPNTALSNRVRKRARADGPTH